MNKTIGVMAHVDAGKTTFSEQLLYHTNRIKERGRVDHQNAFLDTHAIEKNRGITIFSDQAHMHYRDSHYYLVDTPGHVDFSSEMERSVQVMDYAIVIVSGIEGVQGHTETVWQLLRKHAVPTFFFINKTDRDTADVQRVLGEIRENLTGDVFDITTEFDGDEMSDALKEFVAERDETLLEQYMDGQYDKSFWLNTLRQMINQRRFFACCSGSALHDTGIKEFLKKMDTLTLTDYNSEKNFAGRVYKIRYDENGTRLTFIKALLGTVQVRDSIEYDDGLSEKITQIRIYNGEKYDVVDRVCAGQLFAVTGLTKVRTGDGLGILKEKAIYEMIPSLTSRVVYNGEKDPGEILKIFRLLESEDPMLNVSWHEILKEINIQVMGVVQLEILQQILKERFNLEIAFENPKILYKETVDTTVMGYGHFEPLRHYAEVHLKMEPGVRNSGVVFINDCEPDVLTKGHQNLIQQHILEKNHHGLLTGSPLTDIKISLIRGRAHVKHTSGGDFREATLRALRQGLEKAVNVLLEPWYQFRIKVEMAHIGRVLSDIQKASGTAEPPDVVGTKATITGRVPVSTFMNYSTQLTSFTGGKGTINLIFDGYYPCHNPEAIVEKIRYDKDADPEYSSSSVFCSKGQGYVVPWDEAENEMHCL